MKKILLSFLSAFLIFTLSAQVSEDFSDYTVGGKLAQQAQAMDRDYWTTWSNAPGGNEDGVIDEIDGNKALKLVAVSATNSNDQILRLGTKNGSTWEPRTSGAWELTFKIYIPATKDGYFNIKSVFPSTVSETWAMQIYFATDQGEEAGQIGPYTPGLGIIYGGSSNGTNFTFAHDTWVPVKVFIDLDDDVAEFYVNNSLVHTYQYSLGSFGNSNHRTIAAMNIFPPSESARSTFYIDDIVFANASGPQILFETNFDELAANAYVAQSYPDWWTTWDNNPGTNEDALIVTEQAESTPNSAKCDWGTDLMFLAGDKTSGVYTIDFDMYIPNNAPAYFNLLHFFDPGSGGQDSEWAIGVYMNIPSGTSGMPVGTNLRVGGNTSLTPFTVPSNTWFPVSFYIDIDNDEASVSINNVDLLTWQFSLIESGGIGERQLGRIDFYPPAAASVFYLDNFVYATLSEVETFPIIDVTPTEITEVLVPGATVTKTITVKNTGTSVGEYVASVELDFEPVTGTTNYNLAYAIGDDPGAIGYNNGACTVEIAAKFPLPFYCNMVGTYINKVSFFMYQASEDNKLTARVYGGDTFNKPGEILAETTINNPVIGMWNDITLPTPVLLSGQDIWVAFEMRQPDGGYLMTYHNLVPAVENGDWERRNGGAWSQLHVSNPDLGGVWMIKAFAQGSVMPGCWISLDGATYGNVPKNGEKTFNAVFNADGLDEGEYNANIIVKTNDELHPELTIVCKIVVGNGPYIEIDITPIIETIEIKDGNPTSVTHTITVSNKKGNEEGTFTATVEGDDWLTLSGEITEVVVASGGEETFDAIFEAAELESGTYDATIVITTTDDHHPEFVIPCKLIVSHIGIDDYTIQTLVFPNPAQDQVTVKSNTFINSIQVFNNMGQLVFATNVNGEETTIHTSNFNAGVYFMKVNTSEGSQSVKLIVK